jgi:hypothetical protein
MIQSGALSMNEWDHYMAELDKSGQDIFSFTLMGGFEECELPEENEEIESLALQHHLGNISERAVHALKYAVGRRDSERRAAIRRALAEGA